MVESSRRVPVGGSSFWPNLMDPFRTLGSSVAQLFSPQADAKGKEDAYEISLELPGIAEKDVDITLTDDVLTVKGEKRASREEKGADYFIAERSYGAFQRAFRLPADADTGKVSADMKDGVLTITVPRTSTPRGARKISVTKG